MEIPELCKVSLAPERRNDPVFNFEVFAETVGEHYAFMELNQIDWKSLYARQKAKINTGSTEVELYQVIQETLEELNDNHAYLEATEEVYTALEALDDSQADVSAESGENMREYGDFEVAQMVAEHHLLQEMTRDSWLIQWGLMDEGIGFIQVKSMWLYADLEVPKELIEERGYVDAYVHTFHQMYEGDYIEKEVEGVKRIMDQAMQDLSVTDAMVIDIRFNGGGQDAVSFEILRRFLSQTVKVATQKLRNGGGYTPTLPLYIEGSPSAYTKPVYILTSPQTGSAAEAFTIATLDNSHIQRIGAPTSGAMSTALEKKLPNGWSFSISNEIYMDNQGTSYENVGVPVNYDLGYSRERQTFFRNVASDLDADRSNILRAIEDLEIQ